MEDSSRNEILTIVKISIQKFYIYQMNYNLSRWKEIASSEKIIHVFTSLVKKKGQLID